MPDESPLSTQHSALSTQHSALRKHSALSTRHLYIGIAIVLFVGARLFQGQVVDPLAEHLALREQDRGQVQLTESAVSVLLTGSRGFLTCYLWMKADEYKEKNYLSELELCVGALTKLQAHFIAPWEFQGWNLSYNVAAQCDRASDKYYFICRGIELLAEGDRRNRHNPDLRYQLGFDYRWRICESDDRNLFRSLFQLSCIDPARADPYRLQKQDDNGHWLVDMEKFEKFCRKHPQLIRRLHEPPKRQGVFVCETPEAVIRFLGDYRRLTISL